MMFSEITQTGKIPKDASRESVIASALSDWACCVAGSKPPEKFGIGMVQVSIYLGTFATPDNLSLLADEIINQKELEIPQNIIK